MSVNPPKVTSTVETITPAIAREYLEHNKTNRAMRRTALAAYRRDMQSGRWAFTAEPIKFDWRGHLIDGQHRLAALADLEGITIKALVVRGLDPDAQLQMDQGARRTPGDQLTLIGVRNGNAVAAVVRSYLTWTRGGYFGDNKRFTLTTQDVIKYVEENPEVEEFVQLRLTLLHAIQAPNSLAGGIWYRFGEVDIEAADEFMARVADGQMIKIGDPQYALREKLRRLASASVRTSDREITLYFVKAWTAWRKGKSVTNFTKPNRIQWTPSDLPDPR